MADFGERIYFVLATILIIAAGIGIVSSLFSQPLILAYILSGAVIGFLSSNFVAIPTPTETFGFFSQIGIALILFMVGIELSLSDLKNIGKPVFLATLFHALVIGLSTFILALLFKFTLLASFYIALAIIFSSTVIVVKLLGEQKDTNSLYGKLTIGILLLQDLFAVVILMFLAGIGPRGQPFEWRGLIFTFIKGAFLIGALWLGSKYALKRIFAYVASNLELLFLCTMAWALGVSSIFKFLGFSFEIGAFLSGVALAQVSEFSLIIVVVGARLGHVNSEVVSFISSVAIFTIAVSSYLVINGSRIYRLLGSKVKIIEKRKTVTTAIAKKDLQNHIILVGAEQMGSDILDFLRIKIKETDQTLIVVDFNPAIVESLIAGNVNVIFGDISDPEVLEQLKLSEAKLIVTTVPDLVDNINLIKFAKENGYAGPVICATYWLHDAIKLYEVGADYVVVPEEIGGNMLPEFCRTIGIT